MPFPTIPPPVRLNWGLSPYGQALERMRALHQAVASGQAGEALVRLEHPPVITLGRRGQAGHVLCPAAELARRGIEVHRVERGGDVTYHAPGQAVVYPIINLRARRLGVRALVGMLEQAVCRVAAAWGVTAQGDPLRPGVWVEGAKLAALGLAVRQGVSLHGLALNVNTDLDGFALINPCGLDAPVTSLAKLRGRPLPMEPVFQGLLAELEALLARPIIPS